ncbi:MAG: antibiotic biosynthesis monooxygenase [Chitinophagaceae bacterium]|nr:antibiotic biosynthesis monooxygenase [Chitinophagaceae bacterium]
MPITRIVKMVFRPEEIGKFQQLFAERKDHIRHFPGCRHLELWQDDKQKNVFFTYSIWDSEEYLDHYRFSGFFKETWTLTKALFAGKPEAWTLNQLVICEE